MATPLPIEEQMTVEEFLAFTETRPQEERWELIEGRPVMNPSPTSWHQIIAGSIVSELAVIKRQTGAAWVPLLGIGTRVPISRNSLPTPDVMVLQSPPRGEPSAVTDDALVLFEVLSKSNTKADQAWRRRVYASIPNCQHYVTVSQKAVEVVRYDRAADWKEARIAGLGGTLALAALGPEAAIGLAEIYRWTPLGGAA